MKELHEIAGALFGGFHGLRQQETALNSTDFQTQMTPELPHASRKFAVFLCPDL